MLTCKSASDDEKKTAFLQVFSSWPHASEPGLHLERRLASIQHQRATWFVGISEGEVVSSCGAYPFMLYGPEGQRPARIFGAVFTAPAHRGRGYAAQLLRWVMQHYSSEGTLDFGLFSDIGTHYYTELGFQALPSWEWSFEVGPEDDALKMPLMVQEPSPRATPRLACRFGIERRPSDDAWVLAKQTRPLSLASVGEHWLLSAREGDNYLLLESSLPQDVKNWELFSRLVRADARRLGCQKAQGWWTAAEARPHPEQAEILPRDKEVLMWSSVRGRIDSWFEPISHYGFRVFPSEHV